jgi:N-methylhydantoinase B
MSLDPITLEVVRNALDSLADEMALVLMRTAYSPVVRDSMDYSTAVCDREGRMVAQGLTTALHLGSFPDTMSEVIRRFGSSMRDGDVFALNDPYGSGGMHLPDIYVIKPIFIEGSLEGFATTLVHHTDIGGITPGGTAVHATEIFQEGLRIPMMHLVDGATGSENQTLLSILAANVRVPDRVLGDLRAQMAACRIAEQGLTRLVAQYGSDTTRACINRLHDLAESQMRALIRSLPPGRYEFEDFIDGFGQSPKAIRFKVAVDIRDDEAIVDWTGTSEQVDGAINAPGPFIRSATYLAFRCLVGERIPNTVGYMRPIQVIAPEGSIVNPRFPAACNARGIVGFRAVDTLLGALAQAIPGRVYAAGEGGATNPSIGGQWQGKNFVFWVRGARAPIATALMARPIWLPINPISRSKCWRPIHRSKSSNMVWPATAAVPDVIAVAWRLSEPTESSLIAQCSRCDLIGDTTCPTGLTAARLARPVSPCIDPGRKHIWSPCCRATSWTSRLQTRYCTSNPAAADMETRLSVIRSRFWKMCWMTGLRLTTRATSTA